MATAADTKDDTAATGSAAENMDFLEGEDYSSIADPLALVSPDGAQFDLFVKRIRSLMEEGKLQYLGSPGYLEHFFVAFKLLLRAASTNVT